MKSKLNKSINIIYEIILILLIQRNFRISNTVETKKKVYTNNLKLALKFNFDGIYIPSFIKVLNYKNIPRKF